jgi:hypothetical protein
MFCMLYAVENYVLNPLFLLSYTVFICRERMEHMEELSRRNAQESVRLERELAGKICIKPPSVLLELCIKPIIYTVFMAERRDELSRESASLLSNMRQNQAADLEARHLEHEKEKIRLEISGKDVRYVLNPLLSC